MTFWGFSGNTGCPPNRGLNWEVLKLRRLK